MSTPVPTLADDRWGLWRRVAAALVLSLVLAGCSGSSPSILDAHGSEARRIAGLWWLMFGLAAAVYVLVAGFIVVAVLRGRHREDGLPSRISGNAFIWWGGVAVPVVILAVLAAATVDATAQLRRPSAHPLAIEVVGKQWWWAVSYPGLGITTANEIHVPVGQPLQIGLDSDNVNHSFWVPEIAGKLDMIPGQHNTLRVTVEQAGTYRGQCAQFCGLQHAHMAFEVIADPPDVFGRWVAREQRPPSPPETESTEQGAVDFTSQSCAGCHTIRGTTAQGTLGPDLSDFGSRHWIGSLTVANDPNELAAWITDAQSIKPGSLMPPVPLSAQETRNIVAYLDSLN